MNILFVTEFFPESEQSYFRGGVQARTYFIAEYLKKKHSIQVLNINTGAVPATTESLLPRLKSVMNIAFAKPAVKPDVIEASNLTAYLPAFFLAKRLRIPVVAWIPDLIGESWCKYFSKPVAAVGLFLEYLTTRLPWNQVIAMSNATKTKLIKRGVKENKISVIYGGVEYEKLNKLKVKKFASPTICSISRLVAYKRLQDLVKAVAVVKKTIPDIRCLIIGEGPEEKHLKSEISHLKLTNVVELLGNLPHTEAMKILKKSHIFCLLSQVEGFGIVTVEAMAAGVPYVNTRIPPTIEITQNGKGGLLFAPKKYQNLAQQILLLLDNTILYENKKKEGKNLAKKFSWSIIATQTEAVYNKVINQNQ